VTKVDFYTGSADKLRTACQLSHKAMQNGLRVIIYTPDEATTAVLDKLLWQYPATAFIPHCRLTETAANDMAVVLGHQEDALPHNQLLISLHTNCLPFFSRFERLIEIVGQDADEARLGRERYKFYKDRGYEMRHFDLRKQAE
jgi:DNA polymerase-3 subunit chi